MSVRASRPEQQAPDPFANESGFESAARPYLSSSKPVICYLISDIPGPTKKRQSPLIGAMAFAVPPYLSPMNHRRHLSEHCLSTVFGALLTLPFASPPTRDVLSGRSSRVHSLAAPAPGSHLSPALWGCASRATSPVLSLMFGCGGSVSAGRRGGQPDLAVSRTRDRGVRENQPGDRP